MAVSVTQPISQAWERMVRVCFRPFSLGKWFVLGFAAWLAHLGGNGGGGRFRVGGPPNNQGGLGPQLRQAGQFLVDNLLPVILFGAVVLVLLVVIWLVVLWLRARMKFVFLDGVVLNRAAIVEPWSRTSRQGNSLFLFHLMVFVLAMVSFAVIAAIGVGVAWPDIAVERWGIFATVAVILGALLFLPWLLLLLVICLCTEDFVIPIMYREQTSALGGWRLFLGDVLRQNFGWIVLFYLLRFAVGMLIGVGVFALMCATCCVFACLMMIPYINAVVLLPVYVFIRAWSVCMLEQFDERWRMVADTEQGAQTIVTY